MNLLCHFFGHKRGPEEDGDAFTLGELPQCLKLVNRVAPCARCGARIASGVLVETPDGHRSPLRARPL
ncbi:MAG TPA: hypothetical protein VFA98_15405 [Thermoanaerobaculia bacterium]|jgi:hypothetical protein|nr:hypothetical protein [Thermoanaerobaculia bacterium]